MIDGKLVLILLSFGVVILAIGVDAAANALGRRDDLNWPAR